MGNELYSKNHKLKEINGIRLYTYANKLIHQKPNDYHYLTDRLVLSSTDRDNNGIVLAGYELMVIRPGKSAICVWCLFSGFLRPTVKPGLKKSLKLAHVIGIELAQLCLGFCRGFCLNHFTAVRKGWYCEV